ncbi:MAG TPA: hypothetical protein VJ760_00195 [Nitrospiraceae bacterium]|nr:hypothetical protein [Nitrospiraceae bacterium]
MVSMNRAMDEHGTGVNVSRSLLWAVLLVSLVGCAGKIERIDIAIPGSYTGTNVSGPVPGTLRVTVLPFEDTRANQGNLGYRSHLWGGISIFRFPSGSITKASAQAFVDYLNRQGWQVTLADTIASHGADVTITGNIQALSIDATSGWMHTDLSAKNTLLLEVRNHSDQSVVHISLQGVGTDQVFWFEPEDAQTLTTEVFEKNFQKFLGDIRIEGRTIQQR